MELEDLEEDLTGDTMGSDIVLLRTGAFGIGSNAEQETFPFDNGESSKAFGILSERLGFGGV